MEAVGRLIHGSCRESDTWKLSEADIWKLSEADIWKLSGG
jgi:hypothetical protein